METYVAIQVNVETDTSIAQFFAIESLVAESTQTVSYVAVETLVQP